MQLTVPKMTYQNGRIQQEQFIDLVFNKDNPNANFSDVTFTGCTFTDLDFRSNKFVLCTFILCDFVDCAIPVEAFDHCTFVNTCFFGYVPPHLSYTPNTFTVKDELFRLWEHEEYTAAEFDAIIEAVKNGLHNGNASWGKTPNMHGIVAAQRASAGVLTKRNWFPRFIEALFKTVDLRDSTNTINRFLDCIPLGDTPATNGFAALLERWIGEFNAVYSR